MNLVKHWSDHVGSQTEKFYKTTLFRGEQLLLGLNCLEPGQVQQPPENKFLGFCFPAFLLDRALRGIACWGGLSTLPRAARQIL